MTPWHGVPYLKPKTSPNHCHAVRLRWNLCQPPRSRCRWRRLVLRDECAEVLYKRIRYACRELQRIHRAIRVASTYTSTSEADRDSSAIEPHDSDSERFSALGMERRAKESFSAFPREHPNALLGRRHLRRGEVCMSSCRLVLRGSISCRQEARWPVLA